MTLGKLLPWLTLIALIAGCSMGTYHDWITVTGTGRANDDVSEARARLVSLREARLDAQNRLLEAARDAITAQDYSSLNDYVRSRIRGVIRSADVVNTRYQADGSCEVDMRIDMNRIREIVK